MAFAVFVFLLLFTDFPSQNSFSLPMFCNTPSVFDEFEAFHIKAYCLERCKFLETCTAMLLLTLFQFFDVYAITLVDLNYSMIDFQWSKRA